MATTVTTRQGLVRGTATDDVLEFRGIPFAAPPVGARRFLPPEPAPAWDGVRDATAFGNRPVQPEGGLGLGPEIDLPIDEDCLFLNVFTPAADDGRRPVMVWIYGGGFTRGSAASYDGAGLARRGDVVVVTINYRLGALGFSCLEHLDPRFAGSGNVGLLDQVAALAWVQGNIVAFGGDPGCVTIFGESAGGHSVAALRTMQEARGLFDRAITQSGAGFGLRSRDWGEAVTAKLMSALDVTSVADLQAVPVDRLLEAQQPLESSQAEARNVGHHVPSIGTFGFAPVHDGRVLAEPIIDAVAAGRAAESPLLLCHTRDEIKLFSAMGVLGDLPEDDGDLAARLDTRFGDGAAAVVAYRRAQPDESAAELWLSYLTDQSYHLADIRLAEAHLTRGADVWLARFSWPSPALDGKFGACHGIDVAFLFGGAGGLGGLLGGVAPPDPLVHAMQDAWTAFARHGDPNTPSLPSWPRYDLDRRSAMGLDVPCALIEDPDGEVRAVWEGVPVG